MKRILIENSTGLVVNEKKLRYTRRLRLGLTLFFTGLLYTLPDLHLEKMLGIQYTSGFDILQHGGYYFLFTIYITFYIVPNEKRDFFLLLILFIISVVFEIFQLIIPGRNFSFIDICSNFLGISFAFLVRYLFQILKKK